MRYSQSRPSLPEQNLLRLLARKHALRIIALLESNGPLRYTELEDELAAASTATLAQQLTNLVVADILERRQYAESPPRVEYELTERGRELHACLEPLREWTVES